MLRLGGLATGNDTAQMVEAILQIDQLRVDRLDADIALDEAKIAAWTELDTQFTDLNTKTKNLTSFLTWSQMNAKSSDSTILTATANTKAVTTSYATSVTTLAKAQRIASDSQGSSKAALGFTGDFTVNGETITVTSTNTLEDIRDSINTASLTMTDKVTATIIDTTLVIERNNTGNTDIAIVDGTGSIAELSLGLLTGASIKNELQASDDLAATVNGIPIVRASNTGITDVVDGITFNFQTTGSATLDVERDTSSIKTVFEEFITAYNDTMAEIEAKNRVSLSSGNVNALGILQGDSILGGMQNKSRAIITSSGQPDLPPGFDTLQSIGIWTEGQNNRLKMVDESKLDDALENNFEEVEDLIRDFDGGVVKNFESYVNSIITPVDGTITNRLESTQRLVNEKDSKINLLIRQMAEKETQLFEKFARMEQNVNSVRSGSQFVLSQFQ